MTALTDFARHARTRADWRAGEPKAACRERTAFGTPKPPDHANCSGDTCGCDCHRPTEAERALWTTLADEIDAYLARPPVVVDLFGEAGVEPDGGEGL